MYVRAMIVCILKLCTAVLHTYIYVHVHGLYVCVTVCVAVMSLAQPWP